MAGRIGPQTADEKLLRQGHFMSRVVVYTHKITSSHCLSRVHAQRDGLAFNKKILAVPYGFFVVKLGVDSRLQGQRNKICGE